VLCFVSVVSGLQPCANPGAPYGAVQAAPFASPLPGGPVAFGAPFGGPPVSPALMTRLAPSIAQFTATLNSPSADSHAALYTTDAVIAPDSDFHYFDRAGAKIWANKNRAANKLTGPIQIQEIREGGDYLMMRGRQTDSLGPGDVIQYWKEVNGQLQLEAMIYNYDNPATAPAADNLSGGGAPDPETKKRAQAVLDEWTSKYAAGDIEGLSNMYTQFSKVFPLIGFVRLGVEGARKVYQDMHDTGVTNVTYEVVGGYKAADSVIVWAYYKNYKGSEIIEEGTDVYVMKEVNGQLKIQYDIFNTEWSAKDRTATDNLAQTFYDEYQTLFNAGKIQELMDKYYPEAVRSTPGSPPAIGIAAIQQDLQNSYNSGTRYHMDVMHATQAGDYIMVQGRQRTLKNGVVDHSSKTEDLLRMVSGKPKFLWDTEATN